ncbi:hypothetical protein KI387_042741 [Taxus chinensis]|uniref:Senescence-associated protein n=1 Tax=Taxus chinensis TaxID=29808 RepID=A0AA38C873_TAXCH|nr:hypothetical protein KI387_042741 [Taxus chinensis]
MPRMSNSLVGVVNFVVFLLSIPILGSGIWLATRHGTYCEKFLQGPVTIIGVFIMAVSLAGFIGACFRVSWLLWIYLFVMFLLIILLFCFTAFAFVVTNKGAGQLASGKVFKENHLGYYSLWLQKRVQNADNWRKIQSCIRDAEVCKSVGRDDVNRVAADFYQRNLSPIQSGCCKPPNSCGYVYGNASYWQGVKPPPASDTSDGDCSTWSDEQDELCYECDSCKAGVLASAKHDWRKVAALNIVILIFLLLVYSVGCCAFRNKRNSVYPRYKGYP